MTIALEDLNEFNARFYSFINLISTYAFRKYLITVPRKHIFVGGVLVKPFHSSAFCLVLPLESLGDKMSI